MWSLTMGASGFWLLKLITLKNWLIWEENDPDLLSYIDLCSEYTKYLCFSKVKQMLCLGPSNKYYLAEDDSGIRTLQIVLPTQSSVLQLQLFVVDEDEDTVSALDTS